MHSPTRRIYAAILSLVLTAAPSMARAQSPAFRGGDVIVGNDAGGNSQPYLVPASGTAIPVPVSVNLSSLAGIGSTRRGEIVLTDWRSGAVVLVPPTGSASVLANVPGGLRVAEDVDGSFLVTSFQSNSVVRVTRSGQTSTVFALTGGSRPYDVIVDENGDYIFCDDRGTGSTAKGVHRVDRTTKVVSPIYTGSGLPLAHGLAFFHDGDLAVMDGVRDEVYRLDRTTGSLTVFVSQATLGNNPESIVESGDGGFLVALEHANLGRSVVRIDSSGSVTPHGAALNLSNLEQLTVVPSWTGPTGLATGANAIHDFALDLPNHPTMPYWIGLSGSVFPGAALPNDPRGFTVNPDGLFLSTVNGAAPSVFVRWIGITDGKGLANPQLDLRVFGASVLTGFTGFAQGFVFDATATNGIGVITNPLRIDF